MNIFFTFFLISAIFFLVLVFIGRKPPEIHVEKVTSMKEGLSRVANDIKIGVKTILLMAVTTICLRSNYTDQIKSQFSRLSYN